MRGKTPGEARTDQIAALYGQQARLVQRQVARRVNAPTAIIEDACQTAWERLCTHPGVEPVAPSAVKWLMVTAMREAWRRAAAREIPTDPTDLGEPITDALSPLDQTIAREDTDELRGQLRRLTDRQRQFLALHAAGTRRAVHSGGLLPGAGAADAGRPHAAAIAGWRPPAAGVAPGG